MSGNDVKRILVISSHFLPGVRAGGPIQTMANRLAATNASVSVDLVTRDRDLDSTQPYPGLSGRVVVRGQHRVYYMDPTKTSHWLGLVRHLRGTEYCAISVHDLWLPLDSIAPALAALALPARFPVVSVSPHGELAPAALTRRANLKKLILLLWRAAARSNRLVLCATSEREMEQIGVALPGARTLLATGGLAAPAVESTSRSHHRPQFVYVSRIHPIKNLLTALESLIQVRHGVDLDVYGPIEDQHYWDQCLSTIDRLPSRHHVNYRGVLPHSEVRPTLARYDALLLPTHTENFGNAIAEALSVGCPVVCSRNTPWTILLDSGAGYALEPVTTATFAAAVEKIAGDDTTRRTQRRIAALDCYRTWLHTQDPTTLFDALADEGVAR